MAISRLTGIPVVFDALHDWANPSPELGTRRDRLLACLATWQAADGMPKVHFSSQDPSKQRGAHAEWIDPEEFAAFVAETGTFWVDCMLEAKGKELALLRLRDQLGLAAA